MGREKCSQCEKWGNDRCTCTEKVDAKLSPAVKSYTTAITRCHCGDSLRAVHEVKATCYDLIDFTDVKVVTKRCNTSSCASSYGPNFMWEDGQKKNTATLEDLADGVLFISNKRAFTTRYLKYHAGLLFRGYVSARAAEWVYQDCYGDTALNTEGYGCGMVDEFRKWHSSAVMYYVAMQELAPLGLHTDIVVGEEITEVFPPRVKKSVKELCGDGHEKVLTRCSNERAPMKRSGRPRPQERVKAFSNGWFMLVWPSNGRVLSVVRQDEPEGNAIATEALEKVLPLYKDVDCFIYDRCCKYMPSAIENDNLKQIKYYTTDKFHGFKHVSSCKCRPQSVRRLNNRLKHVNTSVCEQTFSWFRNYAKVLNQMRSLQHQFLVLYFIKRHNHLVSCGDTMHLCKFADKEKVVKPYACTKVVCKRPASTLKVKKAVLKKPASTCNTSARQTAKKVVQKKPACAARQTAKKVVQKKPACA
jgi:hypothetical protein